MIANIEEKEDRQKRVKNVIVYNAVESDKEEAEEREREDRNLCNHVFKDELGVEEAQIEKVIRLGTRERGKERPILVGLSTVYQKWEIIKNNKKLNNVQDERIKKIRIVLDKTKMEREEDARLRDELQMRKEEGGRWMIKKGKVVKVAEDNERQ